MSLKNPMSKHFNLNKKLSWEDLFTGELDGYFFSGTLKDWYLYDAKHFLNTVKMTKTSIAPAVYRHFKRRVENETYILEPWKGSESLMKQSDY